MKSKSFLIAFFTVVCFNSVNAQNSAVTNAILYQRDGNLLKAKQSIDPACDNEKTKLQAKTWYYKGLIYSDIYKSDKVEVKEQAPDALKTSTEALLKSKQLENNVSGEYSKLAESQLQENWVNLINRGIAYFQTQKYQDALDMYLLAQKINPSDTTAYVYGAYAAEGVKNDELVLQFSVKLLSMNYKSLYVYTNVIAAAIKLNDYQKATEYCQKALVDFPQEKALLGIRTTVFKDGGKVDEGIEILKNELKSKSYDVDLLTNLADLYAFKKYNDKAMEVYTKIIAIEPHNYVANFNAAVFNFQKGNDLAKAGDTLGANTLYKKALDNAKRAKALASEDEDLESLNKLIAELNSYIK